MILKPTHTHARMHAHTNIHTCTQSYKYRAFMPHTFTHTITHKQANKLTKFLYLVLAADSTLYYE